MITERHTGYAPRGRLHRASSGAMIFGVCAGIADHFGFSRGVTRVVTGVAALIFFPAVLIGYVILALLLPKADSAERHAEPRVRRRRASARMRTAEAAESHQQRFRDLDERLQRLEAYLTSRRFRLEREFEKLRE